MEPSDRVQLPAGFENVDKNILAELIADMMDRLLSHNDRIPLSPESLTRFHSRSAPSITVLDYLRRIVKFTNVENACLLITLHYIDQICARNPTFTLSSLTCHRFLITSVVLSSKALCDVMCPNHIYAKVGGISMTELNTLEREFLRMIDWRLVTTQEVLQEYYINLVRTHSNGSYIITGTQSSSSVSSASASESDMDYEISSHSRPASPTTSINTTTTNTTSTSHTTNTTSTSNSSNSSNSTATTTNTNMDASMNPINTVSDNTNIDADTYIDGNTNSPQPSAMDVGMDMVGGTGGDNSMSDSSNAPQQPQGQEPLLFQTQEREEGPHTSLISPTTLTTLSAQMIHHVQPPILAHSTRPTPSTHPAPTVEQNIAFQAFQSQRTRQEESGDMDLG
ncbi:hypothetical protein QCA50_004602 [Cerrena zonata]|uniref:Cyclin-domain-containing protein n=1 Tax=Cerrena zonata TaxID=2478898 RepID=A0AAW0GHY8_9APHY